MSVEVISGISLFFASVFVGADLRCVLCTDKKRCDFVVTDVRKILGEMEGVVETAAADVIGGCGKRNNSGVALECREAIIEEFGEVVAEGTNGVVFVLVDEKIEKTRAVTNDVGGR